MKTPPWDQRIARVLVKPLVKTPVTPNQMTMFTLAVALAGAGLLAPAMPSTLIGAPGYSCWPGSSTT